MYKPVRVLASSTGMQNLQHQAKQYSNESHTIPHRTRSYRNGSNITLWTTYSTKPSSTVNISYNTAPNEIKRVSSWRPIRRPEKSVRHMCLFLLLCAYSGRGTGHSAAFAHFRHSLPREQLNPPPARREACGGRSVKPG